MSGLRRRPYCSERQQLGRLLTRGFRRTRAVRERREVGEKRTPCSGRRGSSLGEVPNGVFKVSGDQNQQQREIPAEPPREDGRRESCDKEPHH